MQANGFDVDAIARGLVPGGVGGAAVAGGGRGQRSGLIEIKPFVGRGYPFVRLPCPHL